MLAPAGNPIKFGLKPRLKPVFNGYTAVWCNSGTAALALSILLAKRLKPVPQSDVIIPAYACPYLVSACAFAGFKFSLFDLDQNNTAYSLDYLKSVINEHTIAIIAINFLGIQERLQELKNLTKSINITLM